MYWVSRSEGEVKCLLELMNIALPAAGVSRYVRMELSEKGITCNILLTLTDVPSASGGMRNPNVPKYAGW